MVTERPLGKAALVGCRYLVGSGLAGWGLQPRRCAWRRVTAGRDDKTRAQRLHRVVGLSRFRPGCRGVAIVGPVLRTMVQDERYGFYPWLVETFPARVSAGLGSCERDPRTARPARTGGRTRENMYEPEPGCRAALSARPVVPVPVGEGLSRESWAENEMRRWETSVRQGVWLTVRTAPRSPAAAGGNMAAVTGPLAVRATNLGRSRRKTSWRRTRSARLGQTRNTVLCHGTDLNFAARATGVAQPDQRQDRRTCARRWTMPACRQVC